MPVVRLQGIAELVAAYFESLLKPSLEQIGRATGTKLEVVDVRGEQLVTSSGEYVHIRIHVERREEERDAE